MPGIEGCTVIFLTGHQSSRRLRCGDLCSSAAQRLIVYISCEPVPIAIGHRLVGHYRSGNRFGVGDHGADVRQVGTVRNAVEHGADGSAVSGDYVASPTGDAGLEETFRSLSLKRGEGARVLSVCRVARSAQAQEKKRGADGVARPSDRSEIAQTSGAQFSRERTTGSELKIDKYGRLRPCLLPCSEPGTAIGSVSAAPVADTKEARVVERPPPLGNTARGHSLDHEHPLRLRVTTHRLRAPPD